MDKWLSNLTQKDEETDKSKQSTEQQIQELKKRKIKEILNDKSNKKENAKDEGFNGENDELINAVMEFANWLTHRTYIKGDKEKIEIWIKNLYEKTKSTTKFTEDKVRDKNKINLAEQYKEIPLDFLEDKKRIAISKKLRGTSRTTSDEYYLKKLKKEIEENLKKSRYYQLLKEIMEME